MFFDVFNPNPSHHSKTFGIEHLLVMIIGFPLVILVGYLLKNLSDKQKKITYRVIGIVAISLDPIYWLWEYLVTGTIDPKTSLPLYFCSIFFFCAFIFAFTKKGSFVNQICCNYICTMNIISAIFGILFSPYFSRYPAYHFVVVRSMIYHLLMLLLPSIIYFNKDYKYHKSNFITFMIPASVIFIIAFIFDMVKAKEGWDYCYFNGGKDAKPVDVFIGWMHPFIRLIMIPSFFFVLTNLLFILPNYLVHRKNQMVLTTDNTTINTIETEDEKNTKNNN